MINKFPGSEHKQKYYLIFFSLLSVIFILFDKLKNIMQASHWSNSSYCSSQLLSSQSGHLLEQHCTKHLKYKIKLWYNWVSWCKKKSFISNLYFRTYVNSYHFSILSMYIIDLLRPPFFITFHIIHPSYYHHQTTY